MKRILLVLSCIGFIALTVRAEPPTPTYWKMAVTPPMGWNSYDSFGDSVAASSLYTA